MISYHMASPNSPPAMFTAGYRMALTREPKRIASAITKVVWSPIIFNGGYRHQKNFIKAFYLALDFDDGRLTLSQAVNEFSRYKCIIGITRSHQIVKEKKPACDRFRVLVPFDRVIVSLRIYRYNLSLIAKKYPIDSKALDGARFFFPCKEIVCFKGEGETYRVDLNVPSNFEKVITQAQYRARCVEKIKHSLKFGLPRNIRNFLERGEIIKEGRNHSCFIAACGLFERGYTHDQIVDMIRMAPFDQTTKWGANDISIIVNSAAKQIIDRGKQSYVR